MSYGRHEAALEKLNKALVLDPTLNLGWYVLGSSLALLNRFGQAMEAYDRALSLDPNDGTCHFNRGVALMKLHRKDEARESFVRAAELGFYQAQQVLESHF